MINLKSQREIDLIKHAGHINFLTLTMIKDYLKPGVTTNELNDIVDKFIRKYDAIPTELGYEGYPKSICISVNDEVVHGIPSNRKLKNGDVVSFDLVVGYKGYQADSAVTYIIGEVSEEVKNLVINTKNALYEGLSVIKPGALISDIGKKIEDYAHEHGLGVVRELCGHGIGQEMHEDPDIPNYYTKDRVVIKEGMVLCIEPMLTLKSPKIGILDDGWTIVTRDGKEAAHFEHTVVVTKDGYEILTGE